MHSVKFGYRGGIREKENFGCKRNIKSKYISRVT
jgi:hypothetical protein